MEEELSLLLYPVTVANCIRVEMMTFVLMTKILSADYEYLTEIRLW